jgi:hypothetical protein
MMRNRANRFVRGESIVICAGRGAPNLERVFWAGTTTEVIHCSHEQYEKYQRGEIDTPLTVETPWLFVHGSMM